MRKRNSVSGQLDCVKNMPPLKHKVPGEEFNIMDSEVAAWIVNQPDVRQYIFNRITSQGTYNPLIKYNSSTGEWVGVDYED